MEKFQLLVQQYGYWVLIFGALVEGESILLMAGGAAFLGFFSLPLVILTSFVGAIIHDQALYFLGRYGGVKLIDRFAFLKIKAERTFSLLAKYDIWLIMTFRFIYGVRTITPIAVGASQTSISRYTSLTIISAAIWSVVVSLLGYYGANVIIVVADNFKAYQMYLAIALACIVLAGAFLYFWRNRSKKRA